MRCGAAIASAIATSWRAEGELNMARQDLIIRLIQDEIVILVILSDGPITIWSARSVCSVSTNNIGVHLEQTQNMEREGVWVATPHYKLHVTICE